MKRIEFNNVPEQVELIQLMGSRNKETSLKAQEIFAERVGPIVSKVIDQAALTSMIYRPFTYNEDENPSLPLDLYVNSPEGTINVWASSYAGGLASNQVYGLQELKFSTFPLESASHLLKKYARRSYLDVVAAMLNRMSQELLLKKEWNGWNVLLAAVVQARQNNGQDNIITSTTQNVLQIDDFNRLITLGKRISQSFAGGTPTAERFGASDLFLSPEMIEQVRAFAYQPMNTRAGSLDTSGATAVALPDVTRDNIFRSGGASEIYGKTLHEVWEFGVNQRFNTVFGGYAGAATIAHGGQAFDPADDEFVLALNLKADSFYQPIAQNADSGATFVVTPDDQWTVRSDKLGFYTRAEMGFVTLDGRDMSAIVV